MLTISQFCCTVALYVLYPNFPDVPQYRATVAPQHHTYRFYSLPAGEATFMVLDASDCLCKFETCFIFTESYTSYGIFPHLLLLRGLRACYIGFCDASKLFLRLHFPYAENPLLSSSILCDSFSSRCPSPSGPVISKF